MQLVNLPEDGTPSAQSYFYVRQLAVLVAKKSCLPQNVFRHCYVAKATKPESIGAQLQLCTGEFRPQPSSFLLLKAL